VGTEQQVEGAARLRVLVAVPAVGRAAVVGQNQERGATVVELPHQLGDHHVGPPELQGREARVPQVLVHHQVGAVDVPQEHVEPGIGQCCVQVCEHPVVEIVERVLPAVGASVRSPPLLGHREEMVKAVAEHLGPGHVAVERQPGPGAGEHVEERLVAHAVLSPVAHHAVQVGARPGGQGVDHLAGHAGVLGVEQAPAAPRSQPGDARQLPLGEGKVKGHRVHERDDQAMRVRWPHPVRQAQPRDLRLAEIGPADAHHGEDDPEQGEAKRCEQEATHGGCIICPWEKRGSLVRG
jgi:hypothetical protein